jgi:hypothetical protein
LHKLCGPYGKTIVVCSLHLSHLLFIFSSII